MTKVIKKSKSLRERKKAATRRAIMETAIRLFSEHGFAPPTIDQIACAASIGKGTVYNYFRAKEEILVAFIAEIEVRVQRGLVGFADAPGPLQRILGEFIRYQFKLKRPYVAFVRVFLSQLILRSAELSEHIERIQACTHAPRVELFTRLRERNLIPQDADIEALVHEFQCLHFGLSCLWAMEGPPFRMALRAVDTQVAHFAQALERKKP
jgi:AcrR family transcriptional regulator